MSITYRPAVQEDLNFLYRLHRATMKVYVEDTWGRWDEDWQRERFTCRFQPDLLQVIRYKDEDAGVLQVQERSEENFVALLEISPAFQKRGIGTRIMRNILSEAGLKGKLVALQVLKVTFLARSFYQRMGFGVTGENDTHYIMACEMQARRE